MSTKIDQYLDEIEGAKSDIKTSITNKRGAAPSGGLSSYAAAIDDIYIPQIQESKNVTISENGEYDIQQDSGYDAVKNVKLEVDVYIPKSESKEVTINQEGYTYIEPSAGYDAMSSVTAFVDITGEYKAPIPNGFRFTGGDIAQVDFSQYDWSMVYDTSEFFKGCTHSTGDWSNFEENYNGKILSGYYMFQGCSSLTTIPQLDTSKVVDMGFMFNNCTSLTTIPQLDTSKVVNMANMFNECSKLASIPQLDTSKVVNMAAMFNHCAFTTIPQLDTSNVTDMSSMFRVCYSLTTIPQLDTSKVTTMKGMFQACSKLTTIPQLDTSNVTTMEDMFNNCSSLTTIPQLDTPKVTTMYNMFRWCKNLSSISQLDTSNVSNMNYMFYDCSKLTTLPDFNSIKIVNFGTSYSSSWLYGCVNLQKLGVVDCDSVTNISYFFGDGSRTYLTEFGGCRNLGKASSVSGTSGSFFMNYAPNLTYESVMNVINGLYDRATAGLSVLTLKLHANHLAMLSEDDIAIATNKGWTIV